MTGRDGLTGPRLFIEKCCKEPPIMPTLCICWG